MSAMVVFRNTILWSDLLLYGLVGVGLLSTVRRCLVQSRGFGEMFRVIRGSGSIDASGITQFQLLTVSLASRAISPGL